MRKIIKNIDKPLLLISLILFIIGLIMIFSASNITAFMKYYASPYRYFMKQSLFLIAGLVAGFFGLKFTSKSYNIFMNILIYVVGGLLLIVLLYGAVKNNAIRWIEIGPFTLQPSEFAKIIVLLFMASYYDHNAKKLDKLSVILFPLIHAGIIGFLIYKEPDLDTLIIYLLIVASMLLLAPIEKSKKMKMCLIGLGGIVIGILVIVLSGKSLLTPGQYNRLMNFHNPCSSERYYGDGNQVCNGYIAINHGGLKGVGLGNSTQKYLYLPEAHTDFIFAIIMEEIGLIGAIGIFTLYFLLVGRIIKIGKESKTVRGYMICYGVACYIVLHIAVNLGGMFGLMPTTGVPLPFMSYGGSFCLCLIVALVAVQRINIENKLALEQENNKKSKK